MKAEVYKDFLKRVNSYHHPALFGTQQCFTPDERVVKKVNNDGTFRSFFGDTVVFKINQDEQKQIEYMAESLHENFGDCFAERINPESYHVTLHDLASGNDLSQIAVGMFENELAIKDAFSAYRFPHHPIKMKLSYVINMVNTSIGLVLIPEREEDYQALMQLKQIFQVISPLDYPLTPHITLAYFGRTGMDQDKMAALSALVATFNSEPIFFQLHIDNLFYQKFVSMNHYYDIFPIFNKQPQG